VVDAAKKAKQALFQIASQILEVSPENLIAKDGRISMKGNPKASILLGDVAFRAYSRREGGELVFHGYHDPDSTIPDKKTGQGTISSTWSYFSQAAEVEVDTKTGEVRLLQIKSAHDVGRVINPLGAEGQIEGAVHQGIGYAFFEELRWQHGGRTMNPNLLNYKIPTTREMCRVEPLFIETDDPKGPFGAKGLGEPASVAVAPAIANAIENAIGCRIHQLPITPEKILLALRTSGKKE
jgi:CO/xanthine dehydrogenase Mo-binding subunit